MRAACLLITQSAASHRRRPPRDWVTFFSLPSSLPIAERRLVKAFVATVRGHSRAALFTAIRRCLAPRGTLAELATVTPVEWGLCKELYVAKLFDECGAPSRSEALERLRLEQIARDNAERKLEDTERRLAQTQSALDRTNLSLNEVQDQLETDQRMRETTEKMLEEVQDKLAGELGAHDETQSQLTRWHALMHSFVGVVKTASPSAAVDQAPYGSPMRLGGSPVPVRALR